MTSPHLTLTEALAVMCTFSSVNTAMAPGDREMLEAAARVVGGSASGTRARFREAAEGRDPLRKFGAI